MQESEKPIDTWLQLIRRTGWLLGCLGVCWASPAVADAPASPAKRLTVPGIASFAVPAGWHELPQAALTEFNERIAQSAPQGQGTVFVAGVQRDQPSQWFVYPYVLVQTQRSGRVKESDLKQLAPFGPPTSESGQSGLESVAACRERVLQLVEGEPRFESGRNRVWLRTTATVEAFGKLENLASTALSSFGGVQISLSARAADLPELAGSFCQLMDSLEIDQSIRF